MPWTNPPSPANPESSDPIGWLILLVLAVGVGVGSGGAWIYKSVTAPCHLGRAEFSSKVVVCEDEKAYSLIPLEEWSRHDVHLQDAKRELEKCNEQQREREAPDASANEGGPEAKQ